MRIVLLRKIKRLYKSKTLESKESKHFELTSKEVIDKFKSKTFYKLERETLKFKMSLLKFITDWIWTV